MPDARRSNQRPCAKANSKGGPCQAAALHDGEYCFLHDPDSEKAAAKARRQGGLRRRREAALVSAYDLEDLATLQGLQRLFEIAVGETLALPNSLARDRILFSAIPAGMRLRESIDLESRVAALEAAIRVDTNLASDDWIEGTLLDREVEDNGRKS